jgi:hypothetical protein
MLAIVYLSIDARAGRTLGIALMLSFMLNQWAKGWFDTPRPFLIDPDVVRTERAAAGALGPGFPSGHAQSSSTFWGIAALMVKRRWFWLSALGLIALISFSRLYLGVHLPIDVLGGLLLGGLFVALTAVTLAAGLALPLYLILLLGVALPFAAHLAFPTPESQLLMGALGALVVGPLWVPHRTDGPWWGRGVTGLLGVVVVFAALAASSGLLPEEVKRDPVGGYLRYFVVTLSVTALTPWLAQTLRLTPPPQRHRV